MNRLSIIGYSGHSYVCIDIALLDNFSINGYYDLEEKIQNPYSLTYLGNNSNINPDEPLFIAIGNSGIRGKLFTSLILNDGFRTLKLIHPKAIIAESALIKSGTLIGAGAVVNALALIGHGCIINTGAIVEHECSIGDFVHIAPGAVLAGNVTVGEGSFVGANSVVKQGVRIGGHVTIGAGSVVLRDVEDHATVVGNPAKIINIRK